jgi:hypothetical protein
MMTTEHSWQISLSEHAIAMDQTLKQKRHSALRFCRRLDALL